MNQANHPKGYNDFTKVDTRCIGGKTLVMQHMKNHYDQLVDTKPQLKITEPNRYIHATKKPTHLHKNKNIDENLEVKVAFRKVANQKTGYTDHAAPISVNMADRLKGRYEKEKKFEQQEHELNMKAMKKKLGQKNKVMKDRNKDPTDPIAHPVRFFRRKQELPHHKIEYLTNLPTGSRLVITEHDGKLKERFTGVSAIRGRASSANPAVNGKYGQSAIQGFDIAEEFGAQATPGITGRVYTAAGQKRSRLEGKNIFIDEKLEIPGLKDDPRALSLAEKKLFDAIVKYNLYKDEQLHLLFYEFKRANATADQAILDAAIEKVRNTLDE